MQFWCVLRRIGCNQTNLGLVALLDQSHTFLVLKVESFTCLAALTLNIIKLQQSCTYKSLRYFFDDPFQTINSSTQPLM